MSIAELESNIKKLENEKSWFLDKIRNIEFAQKLYEEEIDQIKNKQITELFEQIDPIEEMVDTPIVIEAAKKLDTNSILTDEEIKLIYRGMDKTKYDGRGINGWIDFEKLIDQVIVLKCQYKYIGTDIVLVGINLCEKMSGKNIYTSVPKNRYKLKFSYEDTTDSFIECLTKY
jgi:hypothetical protein